MIFEEAFLTIFISLLFNEIVMKHSYCEGNSSALQSRTGPVQGQNRGEQGFPFKFFPNRENPVFITGIPANENRFFPVGKNLQGKPCFHYRDGFASQKTTLNRFFKKESTIDYGLLCSM